MIYKTSYNNDCPFCRRHSSAQTLSESNEIIIPEEGDYHNEITKHRHAANRALETSKLSEMEARAWRSRYYMVINYCKALERLKQLDSECKNLHAMRIHTRGLVERRVDAVRKLTDARSSAIEAGKLVTQAYNLTTDAQWNRAGLAILAERAARSSDS
jgi:hypothetical protein